MAGAVTGLHVFGPDTGPENLLLLDGNFSPLAAAINSLINFDNSYVDSGSANSLIVTVSSPQVLAAYADGLLLQVKVAANNTVGNPTINVNSLGAKTITNPDGTALQPNQFVAGAYLQLQFNATSGNFQVVGGSVPNILGSGSTLVDPRGNTQPIGTRNIPSKVVNGSNYTLLATDAGGSINVASNNSVTVPASVFQPNDVVVIFNSFSTTTQISIVQGTGLSMFWNATAGGSGTTGNRLLNGVGICTIFFENSTACIISGQVT